MCGLHRPLALPVEKQQPWEMREELIQHLVAFCSDTYKMSHGCIPLTHPDIQDRGLLGVRFGDT